MSNMGEVEITLAGKKLTLRCSLRAARTVSGMSGGFMEAYRRIAGYDMATYVALVAAGLDKRGEAAVGIEEQVYDTGLEALMAPLTKYVGLLMNGGREVRSEDADTGPGNG